MTDPALIKDIAEMLEGAIAGGIFRKIAGEIAEKIKSATRLDEQAVASLKELRQHCQASVDLIDRIIGVLS